MYQKGHGNASLTEMKGLAELEGDPLVEEALENISHGHTVILLSKHQSHQLLRLSSGTHVV